MTSWVDINDNYVRKDKNVSHVVWRKWQKLKEKWKSFKKTDENFNDIEKENKKCYKKVSRKWKIRLKVLKKL